MAASTATVDSVDFRDFHERELPRRLAAGNGALAGVEAARRGVLAIRRAEGGVYAYVPREGGVDVVAGEADAATVIELAQESFEGLVRDLETPPALLYSGRVKRVRGDLQDFVDWEPALRAMFHGRPIYRPDHPPLVGRDGREIDPTRTFTPADDDAEMSDFLATAGYVLVKGVFSEEEVATLREQGERLRERAVEGDRLSWWGRDDAGESVLCRVIHAGVMPAFAALHRDPRVIRIGALSPFGLVPTRPEEENGVAILWKNPGMSEGLSDLPWHRDCGMGGHAAMCPCAVMSIYLGAATPEGGELRFLPGSWESSYGFVDADDAAAPVGVAIPAEPGDVSLHYGDGMHAAPPPRGTEGPFRSSVLLSFKHPDAYNHRGEHHYNDAILTRDDGQVDDMAKVVADLNAQG